MVESPSSIPRVTGLILAGGRGSRMGGTDKGLQPLGGRPLVAWALERLVPQVAEVLISANRNLGRYASFGHRVIPDIGSGLAGPLAGMQRGLMEASTDLVVTVPCDAPGFPENLVLRLGEPLRRPDVDIAVVRTASGLQPVFCMVRRQLLPQLTAFIEDGGRKVAAWFATVRAAEVEFDDEAGFANINTPEDLEAVESARRRRGGPAGNGSA